jgi:hypothetical protein
LAVLCDGFFSKEKKIYQKRDKESAKSSCYNDSCKFSNRKIEYGMRFIGWYIAFLNGDLKFLRSLFEIVELFVFKKNRDRAALKAIG